MPQIHRSKNFLPWLVSCDHSSLAGYVAIFMQIAESNRPADVREDQISALKGLVTDDYRKQFPARGSK